MVYKSGEVISDQLDFGFQSSDFVKKISKNRFGSFPFWNKSRFVERKQVEHQYHVWGQCGQFVLLQNFSGQPILWRVYDHFNLLLCSGRSQQWTMNTYPQSLVIEHQLKTRKRLTTWPWAVSCVNNLFRLTSNSLAESLWEDTIWEKCNRQQQASDNSNKFCVDLISYNTSSGALIGLLMQITHVFETRRLGLEDSSFIVWKYSHQRSSFKCLTSNILAIFTLLTTSKVH